MISFLKSHLGRLLKRRSSHWPALEREIRAEQGECAACASKSHLQVHHVLPFHLYPEFELEPSNLVVLCEAPGQNCHLRYGHAGSFAAYNPNVLRDAALVKGDPTQREAVSTLAREARLMTRGA